MLLTIHFTITSFILVCNRDANTSQSVIDIFEDLYSALGMEAFIRLFPLFLTDADSEFSDPSAIELDANGERRRKFRCKKEAERQVTTIVIQFPSWN